MPRKRGDEVNVKRSMPTKSCFGRDRRRTLAVILKEAEMGRVSGLVYKKAAEEDAMIHDIKVYQAALNLFYSVYLIQLFGQPYLFYNIYKLN